MAKKHCEAVPPDMFGIIERFDRLRSDTAIDLRSEEHTSELQSQR